VCTFVFHSSTASSACFHSHTVTHPVYVHVSHGIAGWEEFIAHYDYLQAEMPKMQGAGICGSILGKNTAPEGQLKSKAPNHKPQCA